MRFTAPEGTYDILPLAPSDNAEGFTLASNWHWVEGVFRDLCLRYGYGEIRTPIFEASELIHRSVGEGSDIVSKETYDFTTRGDDRLTLRPEGTAGALRAYVENSLHLVRPTTKMYYIGPIFRYERPQKGRYRQHHQAGVEVLGANGPDVDAEVIALALAFYRTLGIQRLTVKVNSLGTVESRASYVEALRAWAEPLLPQMSEDNKRRFQTNALRMLDSKDERDRALLVSAPVLTDYLDAESKEHFDGLLGLLADLNLDVEVDPFLVRGFDYYTRTTFEIQSPDVGAQSALGGGGRYNRLVADLGGPDTPGIGFGIGLERVLIALQTAGITAPNTSAPVAFLCPLGASARKACVGILERLRSAGLPADMDYTGRRLKIMFEQADKLQAHYCVILGDDELAKGVAQVRDMKTEGKPQSEVAIADLVTRLAL